MTKEQIDEIVGNTIIKMVNWKSGVGHKTAGDIIRAAIDEALETVKKGKRASVIEAIGWTWAEACTLTDNGIDITKYGCSDVLDAAEKDLPILAQGEPEDENEHEA